MAGFHPRYFCADRWGFCKAGSPIWRGEIMTSGRWNDLRARILSALILLAIAVGSLWLGPTQFGLFVLVLVAAMHWELARMIVTNVTWQGFASAGVAVIASIGVVYYPDPVQQGVIFGVNAVVQAVLVRRMIMRAALYSCAILLAGLVLYRLDVTYGVRAILWLTGLVVVTDIAGYFAGRLIGGPKFWPRFSPKKTWSGTIAGWLGAALMGYAYAPLFKVEFGPALGMPALVALSVVVAVAAQLGDIAESAIKRRAGVKDSSSLIPGHGGFLDRFDALISASVVVLVLGLWL